MKGCDPAEAGCERGYHAGSHGPAVAPPSTTYCAPLRCYCADPACPSYAAGWTQLPMRSGDALAAARETARRAREAGDLAGALSGEPIAPPRLDRRIAGFSVQLVAA